MNLKQLPLVIAGDGDQAAGHQAVGLYSRRLQRTAEDVAQVDALVHLLGFNVL